MNEIFPDASTQEIDEVMSRAQDAFLQYGTAGLEQRRRFLYAIASGLGEAEAALVDQAMMETHLGRERLQSELKRTMFQLTSYADHCVEGSWLEVRINTAHSGKVPPAPDLRKFNIPLGPVVVFGASNFPFAYSTAGGDTACSLAAGCSVVVKAHPAHAITSERVAAIVKAAATSSGMPQDVFQHVHGKSFEISNLLVKHFITQAVAFTGSYSGGRALFDIANKREQPIPVFAEMGSINPVFLMPGKLKTEGREVATMYASSITQSAGQFCTNPGLMIAVNNDETQDFLKLLGDLILDVKPELMLHEGIARSFHERKQKMLLAPGVHEVAEGVRGSEIESRATIAKVDATTFLRNPTLHEEVFGPFSLMVLCRDVEEMKSVASSLAGQLTASVIATHDELRLAEDLLRIIRQKCGRLIMNGVPTGVEVALAMHHGGPFPATTDSRFTSVGADGILRFVRPICYQNCPDELLPEPLRRKNALGIWRTIDGKLTRNGG